MKEVKFKELFDYQKKSKIKAGDGLSLSEGKYPFFTSSNTLSKSLNEFLFTKTSLIFGTGGVPSVHFCEAKFAVSTDCLVAQPKKEVEIFVKYFYYFFIQNDLRILADGFKGAGLKHISRKYIDEIKIPLPPLTTQKHIAQILDDAAALRDKTQQLLTEYDQLAQSIFLEMFGDPVINPKGWEVFKLDDLTNLITDGKHGNCNDVDNSGYFFVSAKNIRNNKINFLDSRQIPKSEFEEVDKRTNLQPGDLVMINTGATIGRMAIAEDIPETRRMTFQKSVAVIKVKKELLSPLFLQYVFKLRLETFATKGSGTAIKNLLLSEMKRFKIVTPPIHLQNQFAEKIGLIEQQKALAKQELQQSEDLFNCLLQKAFKGKLV